MFWVIEKPENLGVKQQQHNIVNDKIAIPGGDEDMTQDSDSSMEETKQ